MQKEFIPYELALELKELGFNEFCAGRYYTNDSALPIFMQWTIKDGTDFNSILLPYGSDNVMLSPFISAPLYQQVFRWFREKHNLFGLVFYHTDNKINFESPHYFRIYEMKHKGKQIEHSKEYKTYEEAELECLKKLIEIVKKQ